VHAFIWQDGVIRDLGTLGGPTSGPSGWCGGAMTNLVAGGSDIDSIPNPDTGAPTQHPFLWDNGKMIDLGTLGGTQLGPLQCANSRRQVAGAMTLPGDSVLHAYRWEHGVMTDLGTLGGDNSYSTWMNEEGDVVGEADLPGADVTGIHHAFLWRNGTMIDLG